ncbi:hypothetical protein SAMN05216359_105320 [Roseateles sp. YR242]|nr:hypothetical protein [Roseateles sp. YR242]SEL13371.1 hypothetical protein SAMN05216359_105320 [Roseateles sp. YR242]
MTRRRSDEMSAARALGLGLAIVFCTIFGTHLVLVLTAAAK